jgi:hypothetical protein
MARKTVDPQAKAKRQKVILAVGLVILAGLLAIQGPKTLKLMKGEASEPVSVETGGTAPTESTTSASSSGGAATGTSETPATGVPAQPAAPGAELRDTERYPQPGDGQLVSFSLFSTKDPFVPQVKEKDESTDVTSTTPLPGPTTDPTTVPEPEPPATVPTVTEPTTTEPEPEPTTTEPTTTEPTTTEPTTTEPTTTEPTTTEPSAEPEPTSAVISVGGAAEVVAVGADFPNADPVFSLVSLTSESAEIGIAGGSFDTGIPTVTVVKGQPLTLMNTADGTRYEIELVSVSAAAQEPSS